MSGVEGRLCTAILIAFVAAAFGPPVAAEDDASRDPDPTSRSSIRDPRFSDTPVLTDRFTLGIGGYVIDLETVASAGVGSGVGSVIDLEELLDLEPHQSLMRFDGLYRFSPRHSLAFGFIDVARRSAGGFDEPIDFLGARFVGDFESRFEMTVIGLIYRYSFVNDGRVEAGLTAGLTSFDFVVGIRGEISLIPDDPELPPLVRDGEAEKRLIAPIPSAGMFISYALTPRLIVRANAQFLNIGVSGWKGRFIDTNLVLEYYFSRHVGVGGGVSSTDVRVAKHGEDPFRFDYTYNGFLGYLVATF